MIRTLPQPVARNGGVAAPLAFAAFLRHAEPFFAPQALHPLAIDAPALIKKMPVRLTIPPPRPLTRERPQRLLQHLVIRSDGRLTSLRRARLSDIPARPPLRDTETILEHQDPPAPALRAHQFPRATSRNAWFSRT